MWTLEGRLKDEALVLYHEFHGGTFNAVKAAAFRDKVIREMNLPEDVRVYLRTQKVFSLEEARAGKLAEEQRG